MKWIVGIGFLIIIATSGYQAWLVQSAVTQSGRIVSINCNKFYPGPKGIHIEVKNDTLRLLQDCKLFSRNHHIGEQIEILVNRQGKAAYLPVKRNNLIPFLFFLCLSPLVLYYLFFRGRRIN